MKRITTQNFNDRARSYLAAQHRKQSGEAEMKELKDPFVTFLRKHGLIPEHGKKSFAFASELYRALASFGQSTSVDPDAVAEFKREYSKRKRAVPFEEIFEERTEYVVMPTALLATQHLTKKLRRLFTRAQQVKPNTPSLKVERTATPTATD